MGSMMNTLLPSSPLSLAASLFHWIGATLWISGAVLLLVWAARSFAPERLRTVGLTSLALGALAAIVAMASSWSAPYAGMHAFQQDQAPLTGYDVGASARGATDGQWTMMGGMMRDSRDLQTAPIARPNGSAPTAPRLDATPASPDHLMPDGSMMDSQAMNRATGTVRGASTAPSTPSGSAPTNQ